MSDVEKFVHEGVEVVKTGRTAERAMPRGATLVMAEITPADPAEGTWRKWVVPTALFKIVEGSAGG